MPVRATTSNWRHNYLKLHDITALTCDDTIEIHQNLVIFSSVFVHAELPHVRGESNVVITSMQQLVKSCWRTHSVATANLRYRPLPDVRRPIIAPSVRTVRSWGFCRPLHDVPYVNHERLLMPRTDTPAYVEPLSVSSKRRLSILKIQQTASVSVVPNDCDGCSNQ